MIDNKLTNMMILMNYQIPEKNIKNLDHQQAKTMNQCQKVLNKVNIKRNIVLKVV
jgi:hypothetical protein